MRFGQNIFIDVVYKECIMLSYFVIGCVSVVCILCSGSAFVFAKMSTVRGLA